jgi:hypothetical protein
MAKAVNVKCEELLRRADAACAVLNRLQRPFLGHCYNIVETLRQMLSAKSPTDALSLKFAEKARQVGECRTALQFVNDWRSFFDAMLPIDTGLVANLEIVFEDLVVEKGLVERPHIRSFTERCRNLKSTDKGKVLEIVQRYQNNVFDGKKVSFIPDQLPLAAQRRLVEFSNSLPETGKRERPPTLAPPPPAPPRPRTEVAPPEASIPDVEDESLFAEVMQPTRPRSDAALEHNSHALGNFISDVSPVHGDET